MIELYLFVNPLGKRCLNNERLLQQITTNHPNKITNRIIPFITPQMIDNALLANQQPLTTANRQQINCLFNEIIRDYHAICIQGQRHALQYLCALQEQLITLQQPYNLQLALQTIAKLPINRQQFLDDRCSPAINYAIQSDLQLCYEFKINNPSTAVIIGEDWQQPALVIPNFHAQALPTYLAQLTAVADG